MNQCLSQKLTTKNTLASRLRFLNLNLNKNKDKFLNMER